MKLYRGNIGDFTGGIFASWFMTGVKGPNGLCHRIC